jgi:hypothetical protein
MTMDPITIAAGLIQFAPMLMRWLGGDKAGAAAEKAIEIAKTVTGKPSGELALEELRVSPDKVLEFRKAVLDQAVEFERLAVQNAADVNKTMQAEAAAEHWPTYSWRPAIGFSVALAVLLSVLTVFLAYGAAVIGGKPEGLQHLPGILAAVAGIIGVVSPILGIASWFRGRMQAEPAVNTINRG